ncbi:hypothetical protein PENTCL1PPCAC_12644, partial [Pristionchus entomophagus]
SKSVSMPDESRDSSMEETEETPCMLSRLPLEIRWKIFDFVTGNIINLQQVSKSWREMIEEWMIPEKLPALHALYVYEGTLGLITLKIEIDNSALWCYSKLRLLIQDLSKTSNETFIELYPHRTFISSEIPNDSPDLDRLASVLSTKARMICVRTKIWEESHFYEGVCFLLKHFRKIDVLDFSRHAIYLQSSSELLKKIVSNSSIRMVKLSLETRHLQRCILLDVSERIEKWPDFVLAMFEKAVKSIDIINHNAPIFTPEDFRRIVEVGQNAKKAIPSPNDSSQTAIAKSQGHHIQKD